MKELSNKKKRNFSVRKSEWKYNCVKNTINKIMSKYIGPRKFNFKEFVKNHLYNSTDSNSKLSLTIALGFLASILPIWGFQSILALTLAFFFRLNKLIIYAVSNISQPPITPVIIFSSYFLGGMIIGSGNTDKAVSFGIGLPNVNTYFYQYLIGSIALAIIIAIATGTITYFLLFFFRKTTQVTHDEE